MSESKEWPDRADLLGYTMLGHQLAKAVLAGDAWKAEIMARDFIEIVSLHRSLAHNNGEDRARLSRALSDGQAGLKKLLIDARAKGGAA